MNFSLDTIEYTYRPLKRTTPLQRGWDVFAWQTTLLANGLPLPKYGADGYLGDETSVATWAFQRERGLTLDGIAGVLTQRAGVLSIATALEFQAGIPRYLLKGQLEHESSFWVGNYTDIYPADHGRDIGVAMVHDKVLSEATLTKEFDVRESILALVSRLTTYHKKYADLGLGYQRSWELASGAWNAPAWTDKLAAGQSLSADNRTHIEAYIASTTAYVEWPAERTNSPRVLPPVR